MTYDVLSLRYESIYKNSTNMQRVVMLPNSDKIEITALLPEQIPAAATMAARSFVNLNKVWMSMAGQ